MNNHANHGIFSTGSVNAEGGGNTNFQTGIFSQTMGSGNNPSAGSRPSTKSDKNEYDSFDKPQIERKQKRPLRIWYRNEDGLK